MFILVVERVKNFERDDEDDEYYGKKNRQELNLHYISDLESVIAYRPYIKTVLFSCHV